MKKLLFTFFALLLIFTTSWSLINPGFFHVHDYTHGARIAEMLDGFKDGQLPVRWSENLGYGYGMPLFEFYAPLPFVVGAGLLWLNLDIVLIIKILYIISNVLTCIGAYYLGKKLFGGIGGWVTSAAYTLAPYRAVNLYVRGALSEAWAMMALPWVLLGIVMIIHREKRGFWVLLAGLLTLMLSHNLTTLMFVPVSAVFAVCYWLSRHWQDSRVVRLKMAIKDGIAMIGAYTFAVGLCAFYLFPALLENQFTQINQIFSGYFYYSNHFLYIRQFFIPFWGYGGSSWGPEDTMSYFLGFGQLLGGATFGIFWLISLLKRRQPYSRLALYAIFGVLLVLSAFMTLLRSKFIWDAVPLLTTIQFPWRWLSIVSLMLAILSGAGISLLSRKLHRMILGSLLILVCVITTVNYFKPERYLDNADALYYTDADRIKKDMSSILPDYIPKSMAQIDDVRTELFLVPAGTEQHVEVIIDRSDQKLFKTNFTSPIAFNVQIASYPGWVIEIDGQQVEWSSKGQYGTMLFTVPPGEQMVSVYFGSTPVRSISDTITFLSILGLFGVATYVSLSDYRSRHSTRH